MVYYKIYKLCAVEIYNEGIRALKIALQLPPVCVYNAGSFAFTDVSSLSAVARSRSYEHIYTNTLQKRALPFEFAEQKKESTVQCLRFTNR